MMLRTHVQEGIRTKNLQAEVIHAAKLTAEQAEVIHAAKLADLAPLHLRVACSPNPTIISTPSIGMHIIHDVLNTCARGHTH